MNYFMPEWLSRVNYYRQLANLPDVFEDPNLDAGDNDAAKYMVMNNTITHAEDPQNQYYTSAGADAAAKSDLAVYYTQLPAQIQMVDEWMTGAFHGPNILDPRLQTVGFGTYQDLTVQGYQSATALNVESGKTGASAFPVYWPGNNQSVPLTSYSMYGTEWPDARASCSAYTSPGLPISLQLGPGHVQSTSTPGTSGVTSYSLMKGNTSFNVCEIDEFTYTNATDASGQSWGRSVLAGQGTIVLLPQQALTSGPYTASITVNGQNYTWSFYSEGILYKAADQPEVYVIYGGAKFWIPSPPVFNALGFNWHAIQTISDNDLAAIPSVPQDGTLLREQGAPTPPVYLMQAGAKCHVLSSASVVANGGWDNVRVVPEGALANIPNGNDIP